MRPESRASRARPPSAGRRGPAGADRVLVARVRVVRRRTRGRVQDWVAAEVRRRTTLAVRRRAMRAGRSAAPGPAEAEPPTPNGRRWIHPAGPEGSGPTGVPLRGRVPRPGDPVRPAPLADAPDPPAAGTAAATGRAGDGTERRTSTASASVMASVASSRFLVGSEPASPSSVVPPRSSGSRSRHRARRSRRRTTSVSSFLPCLRTVLRAASRAASAASTAGARVPRRATRPPDPAASRARGRPATTIATCRRSEGPISVVQALR